MPTTRAMARAKQVAHKAGGGTRLDFGAKDDEVLDGTGTGYTQPIAFAATTQNQGTLFLSTTRILIF